MEDSSDTSSESDRGELAERLNEINDILNYLHRLSFKIRNTKYRAVSKKALLLNNEDPETGKDLFSAYAIFDRRHIQESLDHLRGCPSPKEFASEPARNPNDCLADILDTEAQPENDDFLLDRLAKATTNRRKYFAYWQRHALKLSAVTYQPVFQPMVPNPANLENHKESISKPQTNAPISDNLLSAPGPRTTVSGTDFSLYARNPDDQLDTETAISYTTTVYDVDGKSPELPLPPPAATDKPEFICPYCWVTCPSRQGKGKSWEYVSNVMSGGIVSF